MRLILSMLLFAMLAGCASEPVETEDVPENDSNEQQNGDPQEAVPSNNASAALQPWSGNAKGSINMVWISENETVGQGDNCFTFADVTSVEGFTLELWLNLTTADALNVILTVGHQKEGYESGTSHITLTQSEYSNDEGLTFSFHDTATVGMHGEYNLVWKADHYDGPADPTLTSNSCMW